MDFSILDQPNIDDGLIRLARYCEDLTKGCPLPHWQDFHPEKVGWMLGRLYVIEVLDGGKDYYFRLGGVLMKEIYGLDLEGCHLSELKVDTLRNVLRQNYDALVKSGQPVFQKAVLHWQKGHDIQVQRLLIPFAGPDGRIQIILGGVHCDVPTELLVLYRDNNPVAFEQIG